MAQFDVFRNRSKATAHRMPYFIVLQYDLFQPIDTTVVAPLLTHQRPVPATRLNPTFVIDGTTVSLATQQLASVKRTAVGKPIASLRHESAQIIAALDALFTGL
jgi:toxin CcdB